VRESHVPRDKTLTLSITDKLYAHLETWRPYTIIWCGLVSLAGACIGYQAFPPFFIALLATFIPMMGWAAGLYLSDYLDRDLDAIEKPHRPIPSGRIHPKEALVIGAILAFSGLFLSYILSIWNFILVFIVAFLVFSYAKISKSRGIVGNINRGLITVAAYIFGISTTGNAPQSFPLYVWLLSLVFLLHDTNSNLVGAIRDMKGDKAGGYLTIPVRYGLKISIALSLLLTGGWLFLALFLPFYYQFLSQRFYGLMILDIAVLIAFYLYLFRSVKDYTREKALHFHEFFVIERVILASAFILGIANLVLGITIFLLALAVTAYSQFSLRKQYEFDDAR
jgi:geranylgeranylglycerol-phosphate geranylgeranyltransferase